MIKLDQFVDKWLGKKIDWDGYYDGQCMDLYHQYVHECLGLEHPGASAAYKLWGYTWKDYDKKTNTSTAVPQKGDIIIWNTNAGGGYGHVAVYLTGDVNSFTSLDQNWPTLSKVTKTNHNYQNIYGWLRPKGGNMSDDISLPKKTFEELVSKSSRFDQFVQAGYGSATEVKQLESDLRKSIDDKQSALNSEQEKSKRLRDDYNELVAMVAVSLGTVQEIPQIKVALDSVEKELTAYEDLQRSFAELEVHSGKEKEELTAEIARLNALIQQKDPLQHATEIELIKELVSRLTKILRRK